MQSVTFSQASAGVSKLFSKTYASRVSTREVSIFYNNCANKYLSFRTSIKAVGIWRCKIIATPHWMRWRLGDLKSHLLNITIPRRPSHVSPRTHRGNRVNAKWPLARIRRSFQIAGWSRRHQLATHKRWFRRVETRDWIVEMGQCQDLLQLTLRCLTIILLKR